METSSQYFFKVFFRSAKNNFGKMNPTFSKKIDICQITIDKINQIKNIKQITDNNTKQYLPPKRPLCAYFLYKQEVFQQVKDANPEKGTFDIVKIISDEYKKLPGDKIDYYEQKYKDNRAIFIQERNDYEKKYGKIDYERKTRMDDIKATQKSQNKKQNKQESEEDESSIEKEGCEDDS